MLISRVTPHPKHTIRLFLNILLFYCIKISTMKHNTDKIKEITFKEFPLSEIYELKTKFIKLECTINKIMKNNIKDKEYVMDMYISLSRKLKSCLGQEYSIIINAENNDNSYMEFINAMKNKHANICFSKKILFPIENKIKEEIKNLKKNLKKINRKHHSTSPDLISPDINRNRKEELKEQINNNKNKFEKVKNFKNTIEKELDATIKKICNKIYNDMKISYIHCEEEIKKHETKLDIYLCECISQFKQFDDTIEADNKHILKKIIKKQHHLKYSVLKELMNIITNKVDLKHSQQNTISSCKNDNLDIIINILNPQGNIINEKLKEINTKYDNFLYDLYKNLEKKISVENEMLHLFYKITEKSLNECKNTVSNSLSIICATMKKECKYRMIKKNMDIYFKQYFQYIDMLENNSTDKITMILKEIKNKIKILTLSQYKLLKAIKLNICNEVENEYSDRYIHKTINNMKYILNSRIKKNKQKEEKIELHHFIKEFKGALQIVKQYITGEINEYPTNFFVKIFGNEGMEILNHLFYYIEERRIIN
ncbi:hypothetical protein SLOPH_1158 [Spraguea lophii 42_110]|uniref:Uncharacterized protein n=1 Tax=Spraguea lophii (strain 42_110) TaxID=1358809 RepID=S7W6L6_SPRLO|nr:hypothetical protein SLOPH_1158 [Spraguea lophii 42_110]